MASNVVTSDTADTSFQESMLGSRPNPIWQLRDRVLGPLASLKITVALFAMGIFIILVGCVVEGVPAKLMLVPMLLPVIDSFGIERVHFGIIIQLGLLIGIATPPMGIGLYIMVEVGKVPFERVTLAVIPFLVPLMIVLVLITYFPQLTLWFPNLVLGPESSVR